MTPPRVFGSFQGQDILEVTLRSDAGAEARVITFGATVRDLIVPAAAGPQRVVLGFERCEDYPAYRTFFGASPGRVANRIADGRFTLDGKTYQADRNEGGVTTLHGGQEGFGMRPWGLVAHDRRSVTLALVSPDGDMGFPGEVTATCTYALLEPATLHVTYAATTTAATPLNLCHHGYFNLDGSADILDHELELMADFITPTDAALIPGGEIRPVAGTAYDFRAPRPIRYPAGEGSAGKGLEGSFRYDTNFVLRSQGPLAQAASARSSRSGLALAVWTTEPGVQFYDGEHILPGTPGLDGATYAPNGGFCLEAQLFPNAVNIPHFPPSILRPGQVSRQTTEYRFSRG